MIRKQSIIKGLKKETIEITEPSPDSFALTFNNKSVGYYHNEDCSKSIKGEEIVRFKPESFKIFAELSNPIADIKIIKTQKGYLITQVQRTDFILLCAPAIVIHTCETCGHELESKDQECPFCDLF